MASGGKLQIQDDDMLVPGQENVVVRQPQQMPPSYSLPYPEHAYPPGAGMPVPMGMMAAGPPPNTHHSNSSNTTVIINQQQPMTTGPRIWSSTVCACCDDMGSCLLGTFCPCILSSNVAQDMDESCCVPCCVPGWLIVLRTKLRVENKIVGSVMDDCCTVCCCGVCVLCQMAREIKFIKLTQQQRM